MKVPSFLPLLSLLMLPSLHAALDLTPVTTRSMEDSTTIVEVAFKRDEGGTSTFTPPPGWTIRGQKDRAVCAPAAKVGTEAVIEATPLAAPKPLDEIAVTAFKQQVMTSLPAGSQNIALLSEAENTTMPGGNPSYEIVLSYQLWGKKLQRTTLLVNTPKERLTFRFTALEGDFQPLLTQLQRSMMSWRTIEPPVVTK